MNKPLIPESQKRRLTSIDFTRGLVIVIMALDHIRDLLHTTSLTQDPLDFVTTTPSLFMTRWITHFCAPIFVFLSGVSVYLMCMQQNDPSKTAAFLFKRGLWLIFLEITFIGFGFWFDVKFRTFLFQVIFAIGSGFVIMSALLRLPSKIIGLFGLLIIVLHDALPLQPFENGSAGAFIWTLLFESGFFKLGEDRALIIGYSVIPWLGVMMFGFGFGRIFESEALSRRRLFILCGAIAILLFVSLRFLGIYGDPSAWTAKSTNVFTALNFIKVSKYPPSLLYLAMTLSVMFFVLAAAEGRRNGFIRFFTTYGRVPMYFYLLHWYIVHLSMFVMIFLQGLGWEQLKFGIMSIGRPFTGEGLELPGLYLYWICLIAAMYPLCKWYGNYKAANKHKKWLAYL